LSLNSSEIRLCRRQLRETRGSNRLRCRLSVFSVWCFISVFSPTSVYSTKDVSIYLKRWFFYVLQNL